MISSFGHVSPRFGVEIFVCVIVISRKNLYVIHIQAAPKCSPSVALPAIHVVVYVHVFKVLLMCFWRRKSQHK